LVSTHSLESFSNKIGGTSTFRRPAIWVNASAAEAGHNGFALLPNASSTRSAVAGMNGQATVAAHASRFTLVQSIPLGRIGTPQEIANAILFFACDEADWITGQVIRVSGGHEL
jgi:3-oxoacyl-[acyl-carrier protein] reductase